MMLLGAPKWAVSPALERGGLERMARGAIVAERAPAPLGRRRSFVLHTGRSLPARILEPLPVDLKQIPACH